MSKSKNPNARLRSWLLSGEPLLPENRREAGALALAAESQGLSGLLAGAVAKEPRGWPETVQEVLRTRLRSAVVRALQQLDLAARAHARLAAVGLRSLPLKGAAVAEEIYDGVGERPMGDVDLLVLGPWPLAVDTLRGAGFRDVDRADHAWVFVDPAGAGPLELHHSATSCPGLFSMDGEGLWARSLPGRGLVPRRPGNEDLLVQLSLHAAFQHGLVLSLVQWLDFRRLLERASPSVPLTLEAAHSAGAEASVFASLEAAAALVGAPVPEALRAALVRWMAPGTLVWLQSRLAEPEGLVLPAAAALGRARWSLSAGRRAALLGATLCPRLPGRRETRWESGRRAARRAGSLLWNWALPALH